MVLRDGMTVPSKKSNGESFEVNRPACTQPNRWLSDWLSACGSNCFLEPSNRSRSQCFCAASVQSFAV